MFNGAKFGSIKFNSVGVTQLAPKPKTSRRPAPRIRRLFNEETFVVVGKKLISQVEDHEVIGKLLVPRVEVYGFKKSTLIPTHGISEIFGRTLYSDFTDFTVDAKKLIKTNRLYDVSLKKACFVSSSYNFKNRLLIKENSLKNFIGKKRISKNSKINISGRIDTLQRDFINYLMLLDD